MDIRISGKVKRGDGYGRKIGFPTANLEVVGQNIPEQGVYAGTAVIENTKYRAGIIIGPIDKVEAHLLGYHGDAYGKVVTCEIHKFLRAYKKFDTEAELIIQIKKDIDQC